MVSTGANFWSEEDETTGHPHAPPSWWKMLPTEVGAPAHEFDARVIAASAELPDIVDTLSKSTVPVHSCVVKYMEHAELGPYIAYYLAKMPDYAQRLTVLPPHYALVEVKRLASVLEAVYGVTALRSLNELRFAALIEWLPQGPPT